MKKGKLTLGIVLGLLIIGFVVAQAQAVSAQDDSTITAEIEPFNLRAGGVFCFEFVEWADAAKLAYQSVGGGMYSLNGYDYGTGYEMITVGSMRVVGNTLHIGYTSIYNGEELGVPYLGQVNAQIDLATRTGPMQWAWHYDGYHWGAGTAQIIPCPVSEVVSEEPSTLG